MQIAQLNSEVFSIAQAIANAGGQSFLVGGTVRDHFLKQPLSKDLDIEVYHLAPDQLETLLSSFGKVILVGKQFGVFKLFTACHEYDFSLPRIENKMGVGHKNFHIHLERNMPFEQAAARRDFTINAIGYDLLTGEIQDPFHGLNDLNAGVLRHVGPAFIEDPLRVLRAMQFAARFEFKIAPETIEICQHLNLSELPKERLYEEFKKLFLKANKPSIGLKALYDLGMLKFFPEMSALMGVPQDPEWHPEGDVWTHTLMVIDEAAKLKQGEESDLSFMLGALCHDFGKPLTTTFQKGRWKSPAHDVAGLKPTKSFLRRLTNEQSLIHLVQVYVKEHLKPAMLYQARKQVSDGAIRRLAMRVSIPDLIRIATADHFGRTTPEALAREFPAREWLLKRAENLHVQAQAPRPILKGRHLLKMGMKPGPLMGQFIQESFELQLDGKLKNLEETLRWAEARFQQWAMDHNQMPTSQ